MLDADVVAEIENLKRSYYDSDELMAELEAEAEINADNIIYGKRHYRTEDDLDIEADLDVDLDAVHHGHRYSRRAGLLNNQNGVKGAVDVCPYDSIQTLADFQTLGKTTYNTLGSRNFGHGYEHDHDHGLDIDAKVDIDVDAGHRVHRYSRSLFSGAHPGNPPPRSGQLGKSNTVENLVKGLGKIAH